MNNRHDYLALGWVRGEIQQTLNQAQRALEAAAASPDDAAWMHHCQTHLHQVHSSLQMVEFHGAALLAEEMETLAAALLNGNVADAASGHETLMRAILQLPLYLDRIASQRRDLPIVLLPLLNDLRAARGQPLLSETTVFKPDLQHARGTGQLSDGVRDDPALVALGRKMRQTYQLALLGVVRNRDPKKSLGLMRKLFEKLVELSGDAARAPLWQVAGVLVEGLERGSIEAGTSVKQLLGQLDYCLRELSQDGAASLERPAPTELLKNLLYYVAKADHDSPEMRITRQRFRLDEALPSDQLIDTERQRLLGPDKLAIHSVVTALSEEITRVKEALEYFVHDRNAEPTALAPEVTRLKQVADTVAMLGLGEPRTLINNQIRTIEELIDGHQPAPRDTLLDVARTLLHVEATLAGIGDADHQPTPVIGRGAPRHVVQAIEAVLRECRAGLEAIKDDIAGFVNSHWDRQYLQTVPDNLARVRGGLEVLQLHQAADMVGQCARFMEASWLTTDTAPDWQQLDMLAGVITSVDYYLERLREDPEGSNEVLERASESIAELTDPGATAVSTAADATDATDATEPLDHDAEPQRSVAPATSPDTRADGDGRADHEIIEIFVEEAQEVQRALDQSIPRWTADTEDQAALVELRRAFHTLKGSGRMVGATVLGELAWAVEHLMNQVLDGSTAPSAPVRDLLGRVHELLPDLIDAFARARTAPDQTAQLEAAAHALARGEQARLPQASAGHLPTAEPVETSIPAKESDPQPRAVPDPILLDIFRNEAARHLERIENWLDQLDPDRTEQPISDPVHRALHSLKGSARVAEIDPVAEVAESAERLVKEVIGSARLVDRDTIDLLRATHAHLYAMVNALSPEEAEPADSRALIRSLNAAHEDLCHGNDGPGSPLLAVLLSTDMNPIMDADQLLAQWADNPAQTGQLAGLAETLERVGESALAAGFGGIHDLARALANCCAAIHDGRLDFGMLLLERLRVGNEALLDMLDRLAAGQTVRGKAQLVDALNKLLQPSTDDAPAPPPSTPTADPGGELLGLFLEEANDILESAEQNLSRWQEAPQGSTEVQALQRDLHTLKGGARMADVAGIGDLAHELEAVYEAAGAQGLVVDSALFDLLHRCHDRLAEVVTALQKGRVPVDTDDLVREVRHYPGPGQPVAASTDSDEDNLTSTAAEQPQPVSEPGHDRRPSRRGETTRIPTEVLESLVNLAGETSINRSRVEQSIGEFRLSVKEMGTTVSRLYEQLRRLDVETELQIRANYQKGVDRGEVDEHFDPLELDQYSELYQLTRQLAESASDLLDLKNTLADRIRDTETRLLQQQRTSTELQETLTRARMVPFSRLVPRLRRTVRQTAAEVGKRIDFQVINPEGELDRTQMGRMVAPLEHMLRNAVGHGIESAGQRRVADKGETGQIRLKLSREADEVVLTLEDDGRGIDTGAVRRRAVERGLMNESTPLSDEDIQQFIFHAGFSTAEQITQLSGRGVGLDVVASEVRKLGGSILIDSRAGQGSRFVIRLPFTVAMNRAMLVRVGNDNYAIPLTQIEAIVRIGPDEGFGSDATAAYRYAEHDYAIRYLGQFVQDPATAVIDHPHQPLPALLVRSPNRNVALVVDQLIGSREVVVKSLGAQLANITGISGATILGDGTVVVIVDIHSLIRAARMPSPIQSARIDQPPPAGSPAEPARSRNTALILVVDDSVTVRKVTGRLLERNGYEVVTAKDGIDAIEVLADQTPDAILLDIEMPRMNGYEVITQVRHDTRLKEVPIIMITSRTGEKHRRRALDMGANSYLGKPFQESELLATLGKLRHATRQTHS